MSVRGKVARDIIFILENIREDVYDFSTSANYLTRYPKFGPGNRNRTCKVSNNYFYIFNHFASKHFETRESAKKVESISRKYKGAW